MLAQQLKTRGMAEVGERLEQLLAPSGTGVEGSGEDTPAGLLASLELSLDKLDAAARQVLPRLGVFPGGAIENELINITGLGESGQREQLEGFLAAVEAGKAERLSARAQAAAGEAGSRPWFLAQSNRGEELLAAGPSTLSDLLPSEPPESA